MIGFYYTGQRPSSPISIQVVDNDGAALNLNIYTTLEVRMLDNRNNEIDLSGSLLAAAPGVGKLYFRLPTDRSVFNESGQYVMQLKMSADNVVDYTSEYTIRVKELGGK